MYLFEKNLTITTNDERMSVLMKGVIVHRKNNSRTVMMIIIKIYMHPWHVYLVMTKVLVEI